MELELWEASGGVGIARSERSGFFRFVSFFLINFSDLTFFFLLCFFDLSFFENKSKIK